MRTLGDDDRARLLELLALRLDRRWRRGLLQGAVTFGVIRQSEWATLMNQIGNPRPTCIWEAR